ARHRHGQVEAIEECARELVAKGAETLWGARADGSRIAARSAWAEVHRRHELEAGGVESVPSRPRDADHPVLQRLAESFESRAEELGELVEEQHAAMSQAGFTRPRPGSTADDRGHRRAVMRGPERRHR